METNIIIQGERRTVYIGGDIYFDIAAQLILIVYLSLSDTDNRIVFTKVTSEEYPDAGRIELSDNTGSAVMVKLEPEMTLRLRTGRYEAELKQVINGSEKIFKSTNSFMTLRSTVTDKVI